MQLQWRLYYEDGTTYDNLQGDEFNAPAVGLICIVNKDEQHGTNLVALNDYYWFRNNMWFGGDKFGLYDYLCQMGQKKVVFGRTVSNERYHEVIKQATNDPDFPPKSARSPQEKF